MNTLVSCIINFDTVLNCIILCKGAYRKQWHFNYVRMLSGHILYREIATIPITNYYLYVSYTYCTYVSMYAYIMELQMSVV